MIDDSHSLKAPFLLLIFIGVIVISFCLVGCDKPVNLDAENALYINDNVLSEDEIYIYNQGALYKALSEEGKLYIDTTHPISVSREQKDNKVKIYIANLSEEALKENQTYIYTNETLVSTKIPDNLIGHVYMNESEYYSNYPRNRTYLTGMPSGNYAPEPLKGEALNNYFQSLNLNEEYIYVMIQFETLESDPKRDEIEILEKDNILLFERHGDTYYAKIPRVILETKSYDFVRWIGIVERPEWKIQETNPLRDILYKNCTGKLNISIEFYENIRIHQLTTLREISKSCVMGNNEDCDSIIDKDHIKLEVDISTLINISLLNFVKKISLGEYSSGTLGGPGSISRPDEYNIYEHINCAEEAG